MIVFACVIFSNIAEKKKMTQNLYRYDHCCALAYLYNPLVEVIASIELRLLPWRYFTYRAREWSDSVFIMCFVFCLGLKCLFIFLFCVKMTFQWSVYFLYVSGSRSSNRSLYFSLWIHVQSQSVVCYAPKVESHFKVMDTAFKLNISSSF